MSTDFWIYFRVTHAMEQKYIDNHPPILVWNSTSLFNINEKMIVELI